LLVLQFTTNFVILFNIPVVRQVIGFIYFTFIPGFIFLKLLMPEELDRINIMLFSIGYSITFLMFSGFLINEFALLFKISNPLSRNTLLFSFNIQIFIASFLLFLKNRDLKFITKENFTFHISYLLYIIPLILSVFGVIWMKKYYDNIMLLLMILSIITIFFINVITKKFSPFKFNPVFLIIVSLSLLFHSSLISNYIYGFDIHFEYFICKITENNKYWGALSILDMLYLRLNSMLSITILPTIYLEILNMKLTWIYKIIYPIIFSFVPIGLYNIWQKKLGKQIAFISTFFFISMNTFYNELIGLNRQMIGELFFVLLLIVILNNNNKKFLNKNISFMIFSFALIISHYALAEIFLLFIFFSLIFLIILKIPNRDITLNMVVFFFVLMFFWYTYTSNSAVYKSILFFGNDVFRQFSDFLNLASRGKGVLRGLGLEAPPTIWYAMSRFFAYLTEFFIVLGFIGVLTRQINIKIKYIYYIFNIFAIGFLGALILVPGLSETLNITRFYHILLFFLAPLCVIGVEVLANLIMKQKVKIFSKMLIFLILVPYFLFQTGFVYEIVKEESWSVPLSSYRMNQSRLTYRYAYVNEYEAYGALWLNEHIDVQKVKINADWFSIYKLNSYGGVWHTQELSNTTNAQIEGIVYLSYPNVIEGKIMTFNYFFNYIELIFLEKINKVFSNGGTEIFIVK